MTPNTISSILKRAAVILLTLLGADQICSAQLTPLRRASVGVCVGRPESESCDIASDLSDVFNGGAASLNGSYGKPKLHAQMSVDGLAEAFYGVLRARVSGAFDISDSPHLAYGSASAIFRDVITIDSPSMHGQPGLLRMKYALNGNTSAGGQWVCSLNLFCKEPHAFAEVNIFVFGPNFSNKQQASALYSGSVSGLFTVSKTFQFTYGEPFGLDFFLSVDCGTISPIPDGTGFSITYGLGQGSGTADFSNTLVLAGFEALDSSGTPLPSPPTFTSVSGTEYGVNGVLLPEISAATRSGKNLIVTGEHFDSGAVLLLNGEVQKTNHDDANPKTSLIGKKVGKKIEAGDKLKVRNSNGLESNEITYSPASSLQN